MKSLEELRAIRAKMQGRVGVRAENEKQTRVVVGMATCGIASGARPVLTALSDAVQEQGLSDKINVTQTGCIGHLRGDFGAGQEFFTSWFEHRGEYKTDEFKAEFKEAHPEWDANMYVFYARDAIELLKWAVEKAQSTDPTAIRDALDTATDIKLYTDEHFTVDPETHNPLNKMVTIIGVENGAYTLIDSFYPEA